MFSTKSWSRRTKSGSQVFNREEDSWRLRVLQDRSATLKLLAPACELAPAEIYEGMALAQSQAS